MDETCTVDYDYSKKKPRVLEIWLLVYDHNVLGLGAKKQRSSNHNFSFLL